MRTGGKLGLLVSSPPPFRAVWGGRVPLGPSSRGSQLLRAAGSVAVPPAPPPSKGWRWLLVGIEPGLFSVPCWLS